MDKCELIDAWLNANKDDDGKIFGPCLGVPDTVLEKFAALVRRSSRNHFDDVREFHVKFGHLTNDSPVHLTKRKLLERIKFLQEELDEFTEAAGYERRSRVDNDNEFIDTYFEKLNLDLGTEVDQDLPLQADALVDMVYVALGTAVMLGLPWQELWDDVQRANMSKTRGVGKRGNLVDCIKPDGWEPPKTLKILLANGYNADHQFNCESHKDDDEYM